MAAGAYKGLTIRIGADTSSLSKALSGANSAIYKTQTELRNLARAAKLDPGNQNILNAQLGAVGNQATAVAQKMATLKRSIAETGETKSLSNENQTIAELASSTENAALSAANAKERWTSLNATLADTYNKIESVDGLKGLDLGEATRNGEFKEAVDLLKEWGASADESHLKEFAEKVGMSFDEAIPHIEKLKKSWEDANNSFEDAKLVEAMHNAETNLTIEEAKVKSLANAMVELNSKSTLSQGSIVSGIDSKLSLVNNAVETATDRFRRLDQAAKLNPTSISATVERAKALTEATDAARQKASLLKEKIQAYKDNGIAEMASKLGNVSEAFERSKSKAAEAAERVNDLKGKLSDAEREYQNLSDRSSDGKVADGLEEAKKEVEGLKTELKAAEEASRSAFAELDTAKQCAEFNDLQVEIRETTAEYKNLKNESKTDVGAAAVQAAQQIGQYAQRIGREVVESSNEIDASYRDLRKTFNAEEGDYQKLYDAAMKYSQSHVTTASNMLEMEAIAAQLGVGLEGGADAIQAFADTAANLDVATDIDADTIALQMGQIMNVMSDLDHTNIDKFGDSLVRLGNNMPTQESNIMQITQRLSAVGDVAGFTTPQLMGWAAAIASTGQRSEAAATGVSNTITTIQRAVGSGGEALEKFAEVAGMSAEEFTKTWNDKDNMGPTKALEAFLKGLDGLDDKSFNKLEELGITGVRQTQTLTALANTVDKVGDSITMANDAFNGVGDTWGQAGDAAREAERKAEGFSGTLAKLNNSKDVLFAALGDSLVGPMKVATDWLQRITDWLNNADEGMRNAAVGAGILLSGFAILAPPLTALGGHLKTIVMGLKDGVAAKFVSASNGVRKFTDAIQLSNMTSLTFTEALKKTGSGAGKVATGFSSMKDALLSGSFAYGAAAAGIGAIAASIGALIAREQEIKGHTQALNDALGDMKGNYQNVGASLLTGASGLKGFSTEARVVTTSVDEIIESMRQHNEQQRQTREQAETTIGMLDKYKEVIDAAAGKGKDWGGNLSELEWALEGLEEITGQAWTAEEVLTDKFRDEQGEIRSTKDAIDELISSRQKEARSEALKDLYTNAYEEQIKAQKEYDDFMEQDGDRIVKYHDGLAKEISNTYKNISAEEASTRAWNQMRMGQEGDLVEQYEAFKERIKGVNEETEYYLNLMKDDPSGWGTREGVIRTSDAMMDAIEQSGKWGSSTEEVQTSVKNLSKSLEEAKVGTREFAELANEDPKVFGNMVEQAEGDMTKLVSFVDQWNQKKLDEKYGEVHIDGDKLLDEENNVKAVWNEQTTSWEPVQLEADSTGIDETLNRVNELINSSSEEAKQAYGNSAQDIANALGIIGISAEEIGPKTTAAFDEFLASASGDIDELIAKVAEVNGIEITPEMKADLSNIFDTEQVVAKGQEAGAQAGEAAGSAMTEAANEATSGQTIEIPAELTTDGNGQSDLMEQLQQFDNKQLNTVINITANTEGANEAIDALNNLPQEPVNIEINVKTSDLGSAAKNLSKLVENAGKLGNHDGNYDAKGNAVKTDPHKNLEKLNSAASNMSDANATYTADGNAASGAAAANVWALINAGNAMNGRVYTSTTRNITEQITVKKATGTYIDPNHMPKHAAGIFTRPTLTNIGWVGEDGAELYSGNSLVPLTNRKYSMPYINDISDAVAKKMGGVRGDNYITLTVTCEGDPNENAQAIVRALESLDL